MRDNHQAYNESIPDDIATPDELGAIKAARAEYAAGESTPSEEIDWN